MFSQSLLQVWGVPNVEFTIFHTLQEVGVEHNQTESSLRGHKMSSVVGSM